MKGVETAGARTTGALPGIRLPSPKVSAGSSPARCSQYLCPSRSSPGRSVRMTTPSRSSAALIAARSPTGTRAGSLPAEFSWTAAG